MPVTLPVLASLVELLGVWGWHAPAMRAAAAVARTAAAAPLLVVRHAGHGVEIGVVAPPSQRIGDQKRSGDSGCGERDDAEEPRPLPPAQCAGEGDEEGGGGGQPGGAGSGQHQRGHHDRHRGTAGEVPGRTLRAKRGQEDDRQPERDGMRDEVAIAEGAAGCAVQREEIGLEAVGLRERRDRGDGDRERDAVQNAVRESRFAQGAGGQEHGDGRRRDRERAESEPAIRRQRCGDGAEDQEGE